MAPAAAPTPAPMRAPFPAPYPVPAPTAAPAPPPTAAPVAVPHPLTARASSDPATTVRTMCRCIVLSFRILFMDGFGPQQGVRARRRRCGVRHRRARPDAARPSRTGSGRPLLAGLGRLQAALGRKGQIVLHGADTRNSAGNLGGPGARADRLDLTRE